MILNAKLLDRHPTVDLASERYGLGLGEAEVREVLVDLISPFNPAARTSGNASISGISGQQLDPNRCNLVIADAHQSTYVLNRLDQLVTKVNASISCSAMWLSPN